MQRTPSPTLLELPVSEAFQVIEEAELTGEVVSKPSSSVAGSERDASEQHDGDAVPARTLCVRHQRMADEGINLKLQDVSAHHLLVIND